MKIDPNKTWRKLEERLASETDPVLCRNLEIVITHMKAEAALDLDGLVATVSEESQYHAFTEAAEELGLNPKGRVAVRKFYEDFIATGAHKLELDVDRLVVDVHCVLTEGVMRMAYPGTTLQAMGKPVDDADAYYLFETRMAVLWPIGEDGLIVGEDTYVGGDGFAGIEDRKL
jgi:hypothetical protein